MLMKGNVLVCSRYFFFFFKQKTAYEMRISDWSSDVCSSDLRGEIDPPPVEMVQQRARRQRSDDDDAEDQEIVERLNLGFFTRPIGLGEQRRAADEQEIPAHTEKHEGRQEMQQRRAAEGDDHM